MVQITIAISYDILNLRTPEYMSNALWDTIIESYVVFLRFITLRIPDNDTQIPLFPPTGIPISVR